VTIDKKREMYITKNKAIHYVLSIAILSIDFGNLSFTSLFYVFQILNILSTLYHHALQLTETEFKGQTNI